MGVDQPDKRQILNIGVSMNLVNLHAMAEAIQPNHVGKIELGRQGLVTHGFYVFQKKNPNTRSHITRVTAGFCLYCGKTHDMSGVPSKFQQCSHCEEQAQKTQAILINSGAPCSCSKCGAIREGGFDWATGLRFAGDIGLCQKCFTSRIDTVTEVIRTSGSRGILAAAGDEAKMFEFIIRQPNDAELQAGMNKILGRA